ncbi:glycosyltransferase family 4 protein [Massilia horti]|uniref:Glycosyltransferase family 1 protein n=1 Tax=Massilia horti TaxID=2562153 RepID=A0A4Y9T6N1_9BURK|nr:glycosyltransferase family 4 protein [Massilia horti]TFW36313.1 glycosyltransferase family 1 protein [Massilia horti]
MKYELIIVSLLDGKGPTGVEMHFNQLMREARACGITPLLVSPYPAGRLWARCALWLARHLLRREFTELVVRWVNSKVLEAKLCALLEGRSGARVPATLYAQDPLSAKIALRIKRQHDCRVVTVVHYNVSEADELVMQGEAKRGGALWRFVSSNEREALPEVDQIIFVSEFMRNKVLQRLPVAARVPNIVLPNFARAPAKAGTAAPSLAGDMIAIGTLEPRKNQAFLLQVLARCNAMGWPYTLTLVGDGPDRPRLEALARQLGVERQVTFAGFRDNAAALIPQHRILVHAARVESFGIVLIEALAAGRPILAPAVGGITEIFRQGVEGYYWPLDNVSQAASILVQTLTDAPAYQRLSRAATLRYHDRFDSRRLAGQWLQTILDRQPEQSPT